MPLIRRIPKRGFNNAAFHKNYAIVNLDQLNAFKTGTVVNEQLLRESKLVRGHFVGIKILSDGELKHGLTVEVDKVSAAAREKIEKAGGTINLRTVRAPQIEPAPEVVDAPVKETEVKTPAGKTRSTAKGRSKTKSPKKKAK